MIDGLRKKIVAINVVSVCIVFFVAMLFVFSAGYSRVDEEKDNRIFSAFDYDFTDGELFEDNQLFSDIALYEYDLNANKVVNRAVGSKAELDVELIEQKLEKVAQSDQETGLISAKIKYAKRAVEGSDTVKIVFSNRYSRNHGFLAYVLLTGGALLVGVGCYFAISMILARIALKPVEESWAKQKQFVADASHELKRRYPSLWRTPRLLRPTKTKRWQARCNGYKTPAKKPSVWRSWLRTCCSLPKTTTA